MKQLRHVLALTLVFCMVFGMVTPSLAVSGEISVEEDYGISVEEDGGIEIEVDDRSDYDIDEDREELSVLPKQDETADETNTTGKVDGYDYNIIHLDCGRKYFSVDSIKKIIDNASAAGFNYIQLAVGNDGMRFLLDDMNLTLDDGTEYDGTAITAAIKAANKLYYDAGDKNELTQSEMDTIIAYAKSKGMGVIPLINTPGHMDAILAAANKATGTDCSYNSSVRTIDVTNTTAVAFTKAFLNKYITYFAGKDCTLFNMGADEYANDKYANENGMGFGVLQRSGQYGDFVSYVNDIAKAITKAGMRPMAFNDGIYYGGNTSSGTFDTNIIIEYWSSGWSSYIPMSASGLADKGFKMVNTHGDYYWVLGKPDAQCSATKARGFDKTVFPGSTISNPGGSTFCIWSDYPGAETEASVISKTADTIEAFGGTLPNLNPTVTVSVNQTVERTQDGVNNENKDDRSELNESIATVVVTGTDAVAGNVSYTSQNYKYSTVTSDNSSPTKTIYFYKVGDNYYPVYAYIAQGILGITTYYYIGYSTTDSADNVEFVVKRETRNRSITLYTKSGTDPVPASTTITITGKTVGTTYITVGGVRYTINVVAENLDGVTPITVEYWITNSHLNGTESGKDKVTITAQEAFGEVGVDIGTLVDAMGAKDGRTQEYWQSKILDVEKTNTSTSGTELQTTKEGDDETLNGSAFTKIRYYNSKWQVYTTTWTDVDRTQVNVDTYTGDRNQLVAYYMEVVDINNANGESELHVNAADWGSKGNGGQFGFINSDGYCSVSVQIVYEDNTTNPSDTTAANLKSKTIVYGYWSGGRGLGTMIFSGQQNYQIYKVTAETGDMTNTMGSQYEGYPVTVTKFDWDKNEETVWEGDATKSVSIGNPARKPSYVAPYDNLAWNTSEYNNNNAILIRVYVKAAATEDSLKVNYVDKGTGTNFYDYNITVKKGTTFDAGFALVNGALENNTVVNYNGVTQTVNSNLKEMPEISSYYRFSNFTLEEVVRSEDGKEVWLYYTFNNRHDFVVDFGVPLHLDPVDIGLTGGWNTAEINAENQCDYGIPELELGGGLTYTPNKVMRGVETIAVDLSDSSNPNDDPATHYIYLYPATNVLYEENVITNPGAEWKTVNDNNYALPVGVTTQSAEKLGNEEKNVHGYDDYYSENTEFSGGSAYMAELTLPAGQRNVRTSGELSFTFTGTGFDLISECGTDTGALLVKVYRVDSQGNKTLEHGFLVDTYFSGDATFITGKGILDYQVPVVRDFIPDTKIVKNETTGKYETVNVDPYGTYEVTVKGFLFSNSGAAVNSTNAISTYSTQNVVEETLASLGIPEEDFDLYEVVYMDDNSILNGGTGAETSVVKSSDVSECVTDIAMGNALELNDATDGSKTAYVYVDGIRVYNTIDPEKQPGYKTSEKNTEYYNVYDFVLNSSAGTSDQWDTNSAIYIEKDGNTSLYKIADYKKQGPENEIYLTAGNAVVFALDGYDLSTSATVHVAAKAVLGNPIFAGNEIHHSTELYYDVNSLVKHSDKYGYYIILKNNDNSNSVLSISGIKVSSNIQLVANEELGDYVVKELNPAENDEFKPVEFSASIPNSVKKGRRFVVNISASTDVESVTVENSEGTVIGVKTKSQADNSGEVLRYSIIAKAPNETGTYKIYVYATNENNKDSAKHELTITVK